LDKQAAFLACSLARLKTGKRMAARMAMIAMTTRSSISVKPLLLIAFHLLSFLILLILISSYNRTALLSILF
jgi:hypothetical protein